MATFRLDRDGIARWLKSAEATKGVNRTAAKVSAEARALTDLPITVRSYTTDRAAAAVTIAHPAGMAEQAKHGTLTRAAGTAGLQVRGR
jgi:hypothetical protein